MSTGPLTSSGSVSGLDVPGLVAKLMANEQSMLTPLTTAAASYNSQLSAYGTVKSALSTFQSALAKLNATAFSAQKANIVNNGTGTLSATTPFTADVNSDAATSPKAQIIQSAGIDAANTTFNNGDSLAIKVGTNAPIFVTLSGNATLQGVADQINAAKTDVGASIITDDQGSHLVLEANTSGTANTIRVTGNGTLSQFAYDQSSGLPTTMTQTQAPQDTVAAVSGSYDITVTSLAQTAKLKSQGYSDSQTFNTGILAIKTGTNSTTIIQPQANTLAGIRDAINASTTAGVNATIVSDGTQSHLVLTAKNAGAANTITVTGTGDFGTLSTGSWSDESTSPATVRPTTMTALQTAADAIVTVDGVAINSPSNTVTNAIPGMTLNLTGLTTANDKFNLTIGNDSSGVQTAVQSFVSAYNALASSLGSLTSFNPTTKAAGALQGDSSVTSIQDQIRNTIIQAVGGTSAVQTLNDLGITFQKDGTLAVDTTKLTKITASNFADIQPLFNGTNGIATKLTSLLTDMLSTTGIVNTRTTGIQASLATNTANQAVIQTRLDADQARYTAQFNALDVTLTNLQQQQAQLTSALAGLAK
ncbi:flagellar hook protein [Oxalobacteraceae bacterium CAVE-383]|nr:flagellar hook protein [Oxalobacteraceae bacterium CAVE-383]